MSGPRRSTGTADGARTRWWPWSTRRARRRLRRRRRTRCSGSASCPGSGATRWRRCGSTRARCGRIRRSRRRWAAGPGRWRRWGAPERRFGTTGWRWDGPRCRSWRGNWASCWSRWGGRRRRARRTTCWARWRPGTAGTASTTTCSWACTRRTTAIRRRRCGGCRRSGRGTRACRSRTRWGGRCTRRARTRRRWSTRRRPRSRGCAAPTSRTTGR